jgi:hypothetical protein
MKHLIIVVVLAFASIVVSGCTSNAVYLKNARTFAATDPKTIQVYASIEPSVAYEVIGYVSTYSTNADHAGDLLKEHLRIQAAQYGANAIIGFKFNLADAGGGGAQGVAIRFLR